jgi:hypothetical protein
MNSDKRLYLTADMQTVVEEGDERAAFLLVGEGGEIPEEEVKRLKLEEKGGKVQTRASRSRPEDKDQLSPSGHAPAPEKPA